MRPKVFSWRLSAEIKAEIEREVRLRKVSVSSILDLAVRECLKKSSLHLAIDKAQCELQKTAAKCLGALAGHNTRRAETAREAIRGRLKRRRSR